MADPSIELLQIVACQLPLLERLACESVCRTWRTVYQAGRWRGQVDITTAVLELAENPLLRSRVAGLIHQGAQAEAKLQGHVQIEEYNIGQLKLSICAWGGPHWVRPTYSIYCCSQTCW